MHPPTVPLLTSDPYARDLHRGGALDGAPRRHSLPEPSGNGHVKPARHSRTSFPPNVRHAIVIIRVTRIAMRRWDPDEQLGNTISCRN